VGKNLVGGGPGWGGHFWGLVLLLVWWDGAVSCFCLRGRRREPLSRWYWGDWCDKATAWREGGWKYM
jgi:hypothetical protein